uniref:Uncharacterized protein n=1 Tax=Nelumbo nucifera TaxID=4432 RepID=A0A822Z4N3_NELNU|nr:TPA_asm: hypothetical protein HUJ06_009076 [Nelumbo nucifera]
MSNDTEDKGLLRLKLESVNFTRFNYIELWLSDTPKVEPPMPLTEGRFGVVIDNDIIQHLDISPVISSLSSEPKELLERKVGFTINYTREDPYDPRELSEFPDIRLWFVRLDASYPWLPVVLDW